MIAPDIWFTLYALAREGAINRRIVITTRKLGEILGISQQTASRRVSMCVDEGLLNRVHTASGMLIQLTGRGAKELERIQTGLEHALAPSDDEVVIEGRIVHGLGEGAYYVNLYASRFADALGFEPFPGTLNVRVTGDDSLNALNIMKQSPPLIVSGFTHEGRTFGDVVCYRVRVNEKVDGAVVIAQRTHHDTGIIEVISATNLRQKLRLKDNDIVALTLVPLHLATSS